MIYSVQYTSKALKQLKKMDRITQALIISYIEKHLVGTDSPRATGKSLKGNLKNTWRYRIGDYRLLAIIEDDIITITVVAISHRKDI